MFGIIKKPNKNSLNKKARSYNRKTFKKDIKKVIVEVNKTVKRDSQQGKFQSDFSVTDQHRKFYEAIIAFRWFRRYSGLNIEIIEEIEPIKKDRKNPKRWVDKMIMHIKW